MEGYEGLPNAGGTVTGQGKEGGAPCCWKSLEHLVWKGDRQMVKIRSIRKKLGEAEENQKVLAQVVGERAYQY